MITKPIDASTLKDYQLITIGRQMENGHRQFVFDCSGFEETVSSVTLVHEREQDLAPYIVETSGTDMLAWVISDTDTAYDGYGRGELRITFAGGLAKSVVFRTQVIKSITGDTVIPEPLQSWYDAMIDYINDHSITEDQLEQAVADYIEQHPIEAPVTSVNGKQGDVVLNAADVGAVATETDPVFAASPAHGITASDITSWNNKSDFSGSYTDLENKPTIPTAVSQLENDAGYITLAPVTSVNNETGAVTLTANDVGALPSTYTAPVQSVDGKTGAVQIMPSGGTAGQVLTKTASGTAWQTPQAGGAVDSVNGQTGVVVLDAEDVGALPDDTVIDDVYWCTYGTTTSAQIEAAITAGKLPCVKYNDYVYTLRFRNSATNHRFICNYGGKEKTIACQSGTWIPGGDLTFLTTIYTAPVTSVNGQTGAVTTPNTTYTFSISNNVITITPSSGAVQTITLPVYDGSVGA